MVPSATTASTSWQAAELPTNVRALFVVAAEGASRWLHDAFANDSACDVTLEEAVGMPAAVTRLRDDLFDVALLNHDPPVVDALELASAIRAGSREDQAVIILGADSEPGMSALCCEVGAEAYVDLNTCTTRGLLWTLTRAVGYRQLLVENRQLRQEESQRRQRDQEDCRRLLDQLHQFVADSGAENDPATSLPKTVKDKLENHYRELLRTYVITGAGNTAHEMHSLVGLQLDAGATARDLILSHVHVVEEMIQGLGSRSTRHVLSRAEMLILEMMAHLLDGYRQRIADEAHD